MSRFTVRTLALLALLALVTTPILASKAPAPADAPVVPELPSLEEQLENGPDSTPAPAEDLQSRVDPGGELRFDAIRACDSWEEQQCPAGCACVVIRDEVNCFC